MKTMNSIRTSLPTACRRIVSALRTGLLASVLCLPLGVQAEGVTLITHGYNPSVAGSPAWITSMRNAIATNYLGGATNTGTITVTGSVGNLVATCSPWNVDLSTGTNGDIIVLLDWSAVADHLNTHVTAQSVAAAVVDKLVTGQNGQRALAELPIHLIGHSRGGGMVCELARLLGERGLVVDHLTPLDPHPLTTGDAQPLTPPTPIVDTPAAIYQNVVFADVYYQTAASPVGQYLTGAYNRQWSSVMTGGYHNNTPPYDTYADHRNILLLYQGTVNLANPLNNGEATMGTTERAAWFNSYEAAGTNTGFIYSRLNGTGNRTSSNIPVVSGDAVRAGLNNAAVFGGGGARTNLTWSLATWPNVAQLDVLTNGTALGAGTYSLTLGTTQQVRCVYLDYSNGCTVTLRVDTDRNPYNNNDAGIISTQVIATATGGAYAQFTNQWNTSAMTNGATVYVYAKVTDGTRTRYFYAPSALRFQAQAGPPAAPSDLVSAADSATQITLSWTDNSTNETGFRVETSATGTNNWTVAATVGAGVTNCIHTNLTCNTLYYYRVCATNAAGVSAYANVASSYSGFYYNFGTPYWRGLFLIYPNTDFTYPQNSTNVRVTASLAPAEITKALQVFRKDAAGCNDFSKRECIFQYDVVIVNRLVTNLYDLGGSYWFSSDYTKPELNLYAPSGTYDSVLVHWARSTIPSIGWGLGMQAGDYSNGATYGTVTEAPDSTWDSGHNVFMHEWLHGICPFYSDKGYRQPTSNSDGGSGHGYTSDNDWELYYRDMLTGKVWEDSPAPPAFTGIPAAAWRGGSIIRSNCQIQADYFSMDSTSQYHKQGTVTWQPPVANTATRGSIALGTATAADNKMYTTLRLYGTPTATCQIYVPASGAGTNDSVALALRDAATEWWANIEYGSGLTPQLSLVQNGTRQATLPLTLSNGCWYTVKVQADYTGQTLSMKAWPDGSNEPSTWQLSASLGGWKASQIGFRHYGQGAVVGDLLVTAAAPPMPSVVTSPLTNLSATSFACGGVVSNEQAAVVMNKGLVWGTSPHPTLANCVGSTDHGQTPGAFSDTVINLTAGQTYYVRAYATSGGTNSPMIFATTYGPERAFAAPTMTPPGNALSFDGISHYVSIGDANDLDLTNNYTLECWFKATSFGGLRGLVDKYQTAGSRGYFLRLTGTDLDFDQMTTSGLGLQSNVWYHVAAVNANGTRHLYVNGFEQTLSGTPQTVLANTDPLCLASDYSGRYFAGQMDEVRIWNVARAQSDIQHLMYHVLAGSEAGLVAYYNFDLAAGTVLPDAGPLAHDGALMNMPDNAWLTATWPYGAPLVTTGQPTATSPQSAQCGGNVLDEGMAAVTQRGICWSTNSTPTLADNYTMDGSGPGSFTGTMTNLAMQTTYYVRAYALNSSWTNYGKAELFVPLPTRQGNALAFNGVNNYINIADANDLDLTANYTLECWIKPSTFGGLRGLISKYQSGGANGYFLRLTGTDLDFDQMTTSGLGLQTNTWYHVAAVNTNGTRHLYVNGFEQTLHGTPQTVQANSDPLRLASDYSGRYFAGQMDEVRIWSVARSQADIQSTLYKVLTGAETGLVACYNFDLVSGAVLPDVTPQGHDGTLVNLTDAAWGAAAWPYGLAFVQTTGPTAVHDRSAQTGGTVVDEGMTPVTQRGICYGTASGPTVANSLTMDGAGPGTFSSALSGLTPATTYFVRAYAQNTYGTNYGDQRNFTTPPIPPGGALVFNGDNSDVGISSTSDLNLTTNYTLECWFKLDALRQDSGYMNQGLICKHVSATIPGYALGLQGASLAFDGLLAQAGLQTGRWYHVAAVNSNGVRTLYLDGLAQTLAGTPNSVAPNSDPVRLGCAHNRFILAGQMDEARIWNVARSKSDILDAMHKALDGNETGLVAYYSFDEGSGTTTTDLTGNGHTGYLEKVVNPGVLPLWVASTVPMADLQARNANVRAVWASQTNSLNSSLLSLAAPNVSGYDWRVFGHDGGPLTQNLNDAPALCVWRLNRVWTMEGSNALAGSFQFDCSGITNLITAGSELYLIQSDSAVFAGATLFAGTYTNNLFLVTNQAFAVEKYYTLGQANILPVVTTAAITNLTPTTVQSGGEVVGEGSSPVTARGVCWNTTGTPTSTNSHTSDGSGAGVFTSSPTGLVPETTYHVRAYAANANGTSYGAELVFTTPRALPQVTTAPVTNILPFSAQSGGNVTNEGWTAVTARGVCWNTNGAPTIADAHSTDGGGSGAFTSQLANLLPLTTYYVRAYASNNAGVAYGAAQTITTPTALPAVITVLVTNVTHNSAQGGGSVTNEGAYPVTVRGVCWNTNGNPTLADARTTDGTGLGAFTSQLTGLLPLQTYYVRAYASNNAGASYGAVQSFTTLVAPPGNALDFNNSSIATGSGLPTNVANRVTLECWVYHDELTNRTSRYVTIQPELAVIRHDNGNNGRLHTYFNLNGTLRGLNVDNVLQIGRWYHVAGVWDGTNINLYLNGILLTNANYAGMVLATNSGGITLGSSSEYLNGRLDEVRIWNSGRTPTELRDTMHRQLAGNETNLIAYYPCNEGSGSVVHDLVNGANFTSLANVGWAASTFPCANLVADATNLRGAWLAQTTSLASAMLTVSNTLVNGTNYAVLGHNNATVGQQNTGDVPATLRWRLERVWRAELLGSATGDLRFDTTGLTNLGTGSELRLLADADGTFANATVVGGTFSSPVFTVTAQTLQNGSYYTLARLGALAVLTTATVTNVSPTTALSGGSVTDDGGVTVTARGVCWSTTSGPTAAGNHTSDGNGMGSFTSSLTGLAPFTTYYVRAYAVNSAGTNYGNERSFTTPMTPPGNALSFNGTNAYVNIPDTNSLDLTNNYTLECWFKADSFGAAGNLRGLMGKYQTSGASGFLLRLNGSDLDFDQLVTSGLNLQSNRWYHVAAVNSNGTRHLYVNGVEKTITGTATTVAANSDEVRLGCDYRSRYFAGQMDEVRLWNAARTQAAVQDAMHKQLTGAESNLVAYYQFNTNAGTVLPDLTTNANTGSLVSGPVWTNSTIPCANLIADRTSLRGAWLAQTNSLVSARFSLTNAVASGTNFVVFGHDNAADAWQAVDLPAGIGSRLTRVWRAEVSGSTAGDLKIDTTGLSGLGTGAGLRLLADADGTFASGATALAGTYSAPYFLVAGQAITNGTYYTLGVLPFYTVTYNGNGNDGGTAPIDGSSPYFGNSTVTVLGNTGSLTKAGFHLNEWCKAANGHDTIYAVGATFTITGDTTLYARWTHTVTASAGANGTLNSNYSSPQNVLDNEAISFRFNADSGYHVASVTGCGISYSNSSDAVTTYTVTTGPITGDGTVTATFALNYFTASAAGLPVINSYGNSGASIGDYDRDGKQDILLAGLLGGTSTRITRIYRNNGDGTYTDSGISLPGVASGIVAWGDYDNDGYLDFVMAGLMSDLSTRITRIYRNNGNGTFTDINAGLPGLRYSSGAWGDYDNDGRLDLILSGEASGNNITRIYHNDGNGVFSDSGVSLPGLQQGAVAWADYDNDGKLDFVLTGYKSPNYVARIYRNNGDGTFSDSNAGLPGVKTSSVAWGDYDNDGYLDLVLNGTTNNDPSGAITRIYHNNGNGTFSDINAGLTGSANGGCAWGDYDNDGRLDLALSGDTVTDTTGDPFLLYRNNGDNTFGFIETGLDASLNDSLTPDFAGWSDIDSDGRLDLVINSYQSRVFHNNGATTLITPPTAPGSLTAAINNGAVVFSWGAASDGQTPAAGLSYNLRVGTAPGRDDILSGTANTTNGCRYVPALGNMGKNRTRTLTLPQGHTYYWSVQAIDTSYAGGAWAAEASLAVPNLPVITTAGLTNITATGAQGGGNVVSAGDAPVTARGLCWNTSGTPTRADPGTANGSGIGAFTATLTGLTEGQTYYVRAWAATASDTIYGNQRSFVARAPSTLLPPGNTLVLNGSSQYAEIPSATELGLKDTHTLELWFKPASVTGLQGLVSKYQTSAANGWYLRLNGTEVEFNGQTTAGLGLAAGYWYHLAAVKAGTNQTLYIYGTAVPLTGTKQVISLNTDPVRLGSDLGGSYFNGRMDEVRIWNTARSQQEIRENLHRVQSGTETGLVAYYTFDERSGTALCERAQSAWQHPGTLTGM
ncbi:MAG: LamG-like jellyroll fold domain-containing protein, partial [Verrucomicrobiota bacterium]